MSQSRPITLGRSPLLLIRQDPDAVTTLDIDNQGEATMGMTPGLPLSPSAHNVL